MKTANARAQPALQQAARRAHAVEGSRIRNGGALPLKLTLQARVKPPHGGSLLLLEAYPR
jgi:hypothetical protein